jgi:predicted ArsR family transcriptional regulator
LSYNFNNQEVIDNSVPIWAQRQQREGTMVSKKEPINSLNIPLKRDVFMRNLIRELAGTLEDVVGYEEAAGYISLVGQNMGEFINDLYKKELGESNLTRSQVADVLVDLKSRIEGCFSVIEQNDNKIVLESTSCPFEDKVMNRPSMCMMTSNVFGFIAAENLGYAKVVLGQTIAESNDKCKVIVYLQSTPESASAEGREYYRTTENNVD